MTDNFITYSDKYGEQYQRFQGVDITASARPRNGLTIQGGVSWGRSTADSCEIRDKVPETPPSTPGATSSPDSSRSTRRSAAT